MTAPHRRWFAFSLRTMFVVVTIFGAYLSWQMQIVRERKAVIAEIHRLGGDRDRYWYAGLESWQADPVKSKLLGSTNFEPLRISRVRRMLGDETCLTMHLPPKLDPQWIERAERAYPEPMLFIREPNAVHFEYRDSLYAPANIREPNRGKVFKTGLIEK